MPRSKVRADSSSRSVRSKKGRSKREISQQLLDLGMAGSRSDDHVILSDLTYKPLSPFFNAKPPRQLLNQILWIRQDYLNTVTTNTTTITENNLNFSASQNMAQYTSYLGIFDQYYLQSVVVTIANPNTNAAVASCPRAFTAIDYDSNSNLGSIAGISAYGTVNEDILGPGKSVTRILFPCAATTLGSSSSAGISRLWVDSAYPSVPFYGYRLILDNTPGAAIVLDLSVSATWALRNNI